MKLYRIVGKREMFKRCGLLSIDPVVGTNLMELKKNLVTQTKDLDERKIKYKLRIEQLDIKTSITTKDVVELFTVGCPSTLIEKVTVILKKENEHELS